MKYRFAQQALATVLAAITVASLVVAFMTPARADDCDDPNPYAGLTPPAVLCLSAPAPPFCWWALDPAAYAECLETWEAARAQNETARDNTCVSWAAALDGCDEDYFECLNGGGDAAECAQAHTECRDRADDFHGGLIEDIAGWMDAANDAMAGCDCCVLQCESAARQIVLFETVTWRFFTAGAGGE